MKIASFEELTVNLAFDAEYGLCANLVNFFGIESLDLFHRFLLENGYPKFPIGKSKLIKHASTEQIKKNAELYWETRDKFKGTQLKLRKQLFNEFMQWAEENGHATTD